MINIVVWGTGSSCRYILDLLKKNVNVIVFIDSDVMKIGTCFEGRVVISPRDLLIYDFDYILIASQFSTEIIKEIKKYNKKYEIIDFWKYKDYSENNLYKRINYYKTSTYENILTGISYSYCSINNKINGGLINLANGSQDIYYDYKLAKVFLENKNIKRCFIGLSYYSFHYDLSKSAMKEKVVLYYDILKDKHNYKKFNYNDENIKSGNKVLNLNSIKVAKNQNRLSNKEGKKQARIDCNKNYPETVVENKEVLNLYIQALIKANIEPIIIVFPASKYYNENFSVFLEWEFKEIIDSIIKKHKVRFYDYFRDERFYDKDFRDVSHLNNFGANKMTVIVNEEILGE